MEKGTSSFEAILEFVKTHGRARPVELERELAISRVVVHRNLKRLVELGNLRRVGTAPRVYYVEAGAGVNNPFSIAKEKLEFLSRHYLYVDPEGRLLFGPEGFNEWAKRVKQEKLLLPLVDEYIRIRTEANNRMTSSGWVDGTEKMRSTFSEVFVDGIYFKDFYSIEKFGKTKLGQLVMLGKTNESLDLIREVVKECKPVVEKLVEKLGIEAVGYIPHSVKRKVQFNEELKMQLALNLPVVELEKAYAGVIVQQKGLSRLGERVENAQKTIFVKEIWKRYDKILLIDDVVGSGSTMNEMAKKLKQSKVAKKVYGFAVVGSMKGFEVIPVV